MAHIAGFGLALQLVAGGKAGGELVGQHKGVDLVEPACARLHLRVGAVLEAVGKRVALKAHEPGFCAAFAVLGDGFARALLHQHRPKDGLRSGRAVDDALHGAVAVVDAVAHHVADQHQPHHQHGHGDGQGDGLLYQSVLHAHLVVGFRCVQCSSAWCGWHEVCEGSVKCVHERGRQKACRALNATPENPGLRAGPGAYWQSAAGRRAAA
ncbi:hypothetical protein D3C72_1526430 [compost metagenome]